MLGLLFDDRTLIVTSEDTDELARFREKLQTRMQEVERTDFSIEISNEIFYELEPASANAFLVRGSKGTPVVEGILRLGGRQVIDLRGLSFCGSCRLDHEPQDCSFRPRYVGHRVTHNAS